MRQAVAFKIEGALREMVAAKWAQTRMASALGVSASTVHFSLKKLGITHHGHIWRSRQFPTLPIVSALRNERMAQGMSMEALGNISGYHKGQICEWERGVRPMPPLAQNDIAQALGFEITLRRRGA
jgi:hypothetical protein